MRVLDTAAGDGRTVIPSPASADECDDLREWWPYVKPLGPGAIVMAREAGGDVLIRVHVSGTEPDPSDE